LEVDDDGRVVYGACACSFFRRNKLRLGPCAHLLAAIGCLGPGRRHGG
jgi:hypothetical protein